MGAGAAPVAGGGGAAAAGGGGLGAAFGIFSALTSIFGFLVSAKNAKDLEKFNKTLFERKKAFILEALTIRSDQIRTRQAQQRDQIGAETRSIVLLALNITGRVAASAASAGVAGQSVTDELAQTHRDEQAARGALRLRQERLDAESETFLRSIRLRARSQLLSATPVPVQQPNVLQGIFAAGAAGAQGFQFGQTLGGGSTSDVFTEQRNVGRGFSSSGQPFGFE